VMNLEDDDPLMVDLMLTFLYTADYNCSPDQFKAMPLQLHAQMYTLADKYQISELADLSKRKYANVLMKNQNLEDYLLSIPEVHLSLASSGGLRAITVEFARRYLGKGLQKENVRKYLREAINKAPEYGCDVLEVFATSPLQGSCHDCGNDQTTEALQARCLKCGRGRVSSMY
jgi:Zn finger protein HypA/HybF involved in hydrogenase expression